MQILFCFFKVNVKDDGSHINFCCNFFELGKLAKDFLNSLVANREVSIRRITFDRYRRTVAELIKDEENIQELIVKNGFGKIYRKYSHQCEWSS